MPDEHDRQQIEVDRADRALIEQAAAQLRHRRIRAGYAGCRAALRVCAGAGARRAGAALRDLRPEVRAQTLQGRRQMLGG